MNERQSRLLAAIIDQFIHTATPIGSKRLLEVTNLQISPATIRSEMGTLEDMGFLSQPHISAGRIPTASGYRVYVKEFMEPGKHERNVRKKFETLKEQYLMRKDQERVYEAVILLSQMTANIAFATIPHRDRVFYMGFANALQLPEFRSDASLASGIAEILEHKLSDFLERIEIDDSVRYYIGSENLLPPMESCSLVVLHYHVRDIDGVIGILGPLRMDYAYNTVALELVADLLRA